MEHSTDSLKNRIGQVTQCFRRIWISIMEITAKNKLYWNLLTLHLSFGGKYLPKISYDKPEKW